MPLTWALEALPVAVLNINSNLVGIGSLARYLAASDLSAPDAAKKIAWAIERGRSQYAFPWQTWLEAKAASFLPFGVYQRVMKWVGEMEETD